MVIKKLINDPFDVVDEMLDGFVTVHADLVRLAHPRVVARQDPSREKVGLVVGGGSGHEPAFAGYVGLGMADAAACGNVFASPPTETCLEAIRAVDQGRGVISAFGNYSGDVMNFGLARELAVAEGIDAREIRISDDVASAPLAERDKRRGIAGDIYVFKCVGAAAESGADIDAVERIARKANEHTRSMGVALSPCEVPGAGRPTFETPAAMMEIGMGIHGEPGVSQRPLASADEVASILVEVLLDDLDDRSGHEFALMVNGLGATPHLDLYILYRGARRVLEAAGNRVVRSHVGEYITSLEMGGASVTVMSLDDELLTLLDAPARTARLL